MVDIHKIQRIRHDWLNGASQGQIRQKHSLTKTDQILTTFFADNFGLSVEDIETYSEQDLSVGDLLKLLRENG